jgi:NAD+ synthase (glutamine-hydrolysing)
MIEDQVQMSKFTLGLAQINTKLGNVEANLEKHLLLIKQARGLDVDLLVFPELSLTGYALQDLTPEVARRPDASDPVFAKLLKASNDLDLVVGFVEAERRYRFYIAAAYLSGGQIVHVHRKVYLPTYGLFDEGRFFAWGDSVRAFETRFGRLGMLICEDFWHASPPYLLWLDGAELLLLISASPGRGIAAGGRLESALWVERINQAYASLFTTFVAHTNRVGFEDGLNFWGGATVHNPDGTLLVRGPDHEEALTLAEIDMEKLRMIRTRLPLLRDERTHLMSQELARILARNAEPGNFPDPGRGQED